PQCIRPLVFLIVYGSRVTWKQSGNLVARAGFAPAFTGYEPIVLSYATTAPKNYSNKRMVRVAGVEPAWTCSQGMWVAATLHPDCWRGPVSPPLFIPSRRRPGATCAPRPPDRAALPSRHR